MSEPELPPGYGQVAYEACCRWWDEKGVKDYPRWLELPAVARERYDAMAQGLADYLARIPP